jgi:flagellar hook-length control protein FliK
LKGFQPDSGGTAPVSAHIKGANLSDGAAGLTSSARRVEVVDLKKTASDSKSEFRDRINARKEAGRMESGVKGNQAADPGKGDSRFAVVETEIGVPGRISGPGDGRTAAAELSRRLDAEAGNEIVRQVKVVLTRADAGEIRINLRPENLGRVRVEIHLDDNRLTGRIFVDSAAAREAFRNSLDGLQTRLVESGFGAADLELAWEGNSGTFAGFGGSSSKNGKQVHLAVREFENMAGSVIQDVLADGLVNMVV